MSWLLQACSLVFLLTGIRHLCCFLVQMAVLCFCIQLQHHGPFPLASSVSFSFPARGREKLHQPCPSASPSFISGGVTLAPGSLVALSEFRLPVIIFCGLCLLLSVLQPTPSLQLLFSFCFLLWPLHSTNVVDHGLGEVLFVMLSYSSS